jgi:asparagine synthase (glutamine-hydrolysing)
MSALGGIYYFDNRPADRDFLINLGERLRSHGPDDGSEVVTGSIGMVYRAFHTNRESRLEKQPLVSREGHILAWDGRLDNREELISLLCHELDGDQTDVAIVMAAYLKMGIDFLPRLVGDFALSLWDSSTRTLLLARDAVGPRPLNYHANTGRIIWSSELMPLLDFARIELEINEEYVVGHLTCGAEPGLTPYKDINAVPPGHVVVIRNGQVRSQRFWELDPNHEIRYQTDGEYEEHFRHLFREAVRCRLRVDGPIWASLSGGLDSSAIVCIADEILESSEAEAARLKTISYVYDEAGSSDERDFISCVEEKRARTGHHLRDTAFPLLASFPDESRLSFPDFLDCFIDRQRALSEAMRADGARVLLTGHGGDEMLHSSSSPSPELGDLLIQRQFLRLHHALQTWSKVLKRSYLDVLWRDAVIPVVPQNIQITCGLKQDFKLPSWLDKEFVSRMRLRQRNFRLTDVFGFRLPSGRDQAIGFLSAMRVISKASYRARSGIEVSHPYLHRPLVEFLQAIPFEQKIRPGETRSLMRRTLKDLLPEKILTRKGKKEQSEVLYRALAREWPRLKPVFKNARVCARGYMNAGALQATLERARHGCEPNSFALIQTITLEFWLRALEHRCLIVKSTSPQEEPTAQPADVLSAAARAARSSRVHSGHARNYRSRSQHDG